MTTPFVSVTPMTLLETILGFLVLWEQVDWSVSLVSRGKDTDWKGRSSSSHNASHSPLDDILQ